MNQVTKN